MSEPITIDFTNNTYTLSEGETFGHRLQINHWSKNEDLAVPVIDHLTGRRYLLTRDADGLLVLVWLGESDSE